MKLKKKKFSTYIAPSYIYEAFNNLRLPENITVSEWAEKYRFLDERSSAMAGRWKNSITPYLVEIMDEFSNFQTEKIVFCKPTQVGGTEALNNMLAYTVAQSPAPCMIVEPSIEMAESFSENRLKPMFQTSPATKKNFNLKNSQKTELQFNNSMYIALTGSNSPANLASKPCRCLFLDEVDKYSSSTEKESDPINLAIERTHAFYNRKIYMCSTPTIESGHIWKHLNSCDVIKHYFIPCPHCGKMIELKFSQLRMPSDETRSDLELSQLTYYECQECKGHLTDRDKIASIKLGKWKAIEQKTNIVSSVGFWISTLYSPFTRFSDVMKNYLLSKNDKDQYHNFLNSWLAEPFVEKGEELEEDSIKERQSDLEEFVVPEWCRILTGGVDVQEGSLYFVIIAWGVGLTSQVISSSQVATFQDIERVMNQAYLFENGDQKIVDLCLIDSGDQTDIVYNFTATNNEWCLSCKGTSTMLSHYRLSTVNKSGAIGQTLVLVDGAKYKDQISNRLKKPNGRGSFMVHKNISDDFCAQLCSEHKVFEKGAGGVIKSKWKPKKSHADNHYLDACVYASCAADLVGVRSLFLQEQEETQKILEHNRRTISSDEIDLDDNSSSSFYHDKETNIANQSSDFLNGIDEDWI